LTVQEAKKMVKISRKKMFDFIVKTP